MLEKFLKQCLEIVKKVVRSFDGERLEKVGSKNPAGAKEVEMEVFKKMSTELYKEGVKQPQAKKAAEAIAHVAVASVVEASKKVLHRKRQRNEEEEASSKKQRLIESKKRGRAEFDSDDKGVPDEKKQRPRSAVEITKRERDELGEVVEREFEINMKKNHLIEDIEEIVKMDVD